MTAKALVRNGEKMPSIFGDFFRPWNEWFDNSGIMGRTMNIPAVNIAESNESYGVSLAVPGMKKEDFNIDVNGNILTISCEKEETKEEKDAMFNRKEYNYSSFSRSFTLPDEVNKERIDANYTDGVLKIMLPKKDEAKKLIASKHIAVK
jgi:HSP20 family protein